jgi:hypothetical protein
MDIKIIRCIWGKRDHQFFEKNLASYHDECVLAKENDNKYAVDNQMVIVWDKPNADLMEKLGYPYHYMGESNKFDAGLNFLHKLIALETAMDLYDEILFLDWDCLAQKSLDNNFFKILRSKGPIQMPLYFYGGEIISRVKLTDPSKNEGAKYFVDLMNYITGNPNWKFRDGFAVPNTGFVYCRDKEFFKKILKIQKSESISTNIEEICSMIYFNEFIESIDSYIEKIEPTVCFGKDDGDMLGEQVYLNRYTDSKLNKDIYFIHE